MVNAGANNAALMHSISAGSVFSAAANQQLDKYDGQFRRVEGWLKGHPLVDQYVTLVASKTGLRRAYILLGSTLLGLMFVIFGPIAKLFGSLVGVSYPAYKSIKAIESPSQDDDRKWLTYWVVFAFFTVARNFSGAILSWFPFYNMLELGVLLWMMAPIKHNGSYFIYNNVMRPFVLKHIDTIDSPFDSVKTSFVQLGGTSAAPVESEQKIAQLDGSTADAFAATDITVTQSTSTETLP